MRHDTAVAPDATARPSVPVRHRRLVALVLPLVLAAGCTALGSSPGPSPSADDGARSAATALAAALAKKDLTPLTFTGSTGADVNQLFQPLVRGMGPISPQVAVADVTTNGAAATATLSLTWTFPGVTRTWAYNTTAQLTQDAGTWKPTWAPAIVEPRLDGTNRLSQHRLYPDRGELLGEDGDPIVVSRPVVRIGIDKTGVKADQQAASAQRLAGLVDVDAAAYVAQVKAAGTSAFVPAIVLRANDAQVPSISAVAAIPGALAVADDAMLAPTRDFARALIGTVGDATAEIVKASNGAIVDGDQVGLSGLEKRYDARMRGTPGVQVELVPTGTGSGTAGPTPSGTPTSDPTPTSSPSSSSGSAGRVTVFDVAAVNGQEVTTTLNVVLQTLAERTVAKTSSAAALVAIRPSTGAIVAAANNTATNGQAVATVGQVAPGSTFKVASSLALLRAGLTPTTKVTCPKNVTVDGRTYKNYDDYPSDQLGTITLQTAVAQSCNTAFVGQRDKVGSGALAAAAASLGLGTDYDVGFPSFFGSVPAGGSETAKAEAMFGQGTVEASPMAMAAVAASVQAGRTVLPNLVQGQKSTSKATPLTSAEAADLKQMMRAVVTQGSGRRLAGIGGPAVIAKTGTAEYGSKAPYKTHAWMIAAQGDLAVAVFVTDGSTGSGTAGPLVETFLRGAA